MHLTDYKVRVLDTQKGTGAVTRVLIDSTDGDATWTTIGVNENIIEASWQALLDSIHFGLLRAEADVGRRRSGRSRSSSDGSSGEPDNVVPTDPFVPADPDRPAAPAAEPAAGRRAAARGATGGPTGPATSGRRSPHGALLGWPGPNVGLRVHARRSVRATGSQLGRTSTSTTSIAVVAEIAGKRAASFGRAPVMGDVDVAIALLGYDGAADDDVRRAARPDSCTRPAHSYPRRRAIVDAVPEELLLRRQAPSSTRWLESWRDSAWSSSSARMTPS